jgi:DNA-binding SARP family transcriptional activator
MLGFRILGPLEIVADGEHVVLPRPKQQELLALLLMRRGETVSTDWLLENLWAGAPPAEARASLQNYVSQLRKALGPDVLVTRAPGYVLAVKPEQTDVGRFERLVEEGCAAERPAERAAKLREGLALWRGSALTEAPQSAFAEVEAARLEELRVEAFEDAIDAELALGAGAGLVSELEQMVAQEPFRERLRAQLMLALYRSGRQAAALEAFQRARATLAEELGLEPSPALRGLERAILNQDAALDLPRTPALLPGERRQLATVLFADLVESAVLADELDPERFRQLLDRVLSLAGAALERHGGTIDRSFGDLAMAVFGVPHAHEDDALRALRAAVDMRSELTTLNKELARENIAPLELRIGVSSGEVFVADPAGGRTLVTGSVVNNAKRLEESACPGEIVLGAGTLRLVRDAARAEGVKAPQLKQERPVAAFRLLELREDAPAIARYFDAALIGRGAELAAIRGAYEEACETGRCRLLTVVGEPGIGKTRLAREFVSTISGSATVLIGRCVAYGDGATVLPLREMVDQVSDLEKQLAGGAESEVLASRVAELVGLSPGDEHDRGGLLGDPPVARGTCSQTAARPPFRGRALGRADPARLHRPARWHHGVDPLSLSCSTGPPRAAAIVGERVARADIATRARRRSTCGVVPGRRGALNRTSRSHRRGRRRQSSLRRAVARPCAGAGTGRDGVGSAVGGGADRKPARPPRGR